MSPQKLTDLTEREQKELIFLIMEAMRKDNGLFIAIRNLAFHSTKQFVDNSSIVKVIR
jgi:hypothetical protein